MANSIRCNNKGPYVTCIFHADDTYFPQVDAVMFVGSEVVMV